MMCGRRWKVSVCFSCCLAWNDVGVGDAGQPLEAVSRVVLPRRLDEEALGRSAELRKAPEPSAAQVRGQGDGQGPQSPPRPRDQLHMTQMAWGVKPGALQQDMGWNA